MEVEGGICDFMDLQSMSSRQLDHCQGPGLPALCGPAPRAVTSLIRLTLEKGWSSVKNDDTRRMKQLSIHITIWMNCIKQCGMK